VISLNGVDSLSYTVLLSQASFVPVLLHIVTVVKIPQST